MAERNLEGYEPFSRERARDVDDLVRAAAVGNVAPYLRDIRFPATREEVRGHAASHGADPAALEAIEKLPARRYEGPMELFDALGDETEPVLDDLRGNGP